ncbi:MAG: CDP-diacylglycerol diphosphatase [Serratia inhibens]|uniref:CDP-diacylglycerol diphosphatase n=1 Tax=Serratia inhibens TaxID=2338073 RepID=UPI003C7E7B75
MKRFLKLLIILLVILILVAALWFFFGRGNQDALWQIVSQQCVPNQQQNNDPDPCLRVDLKEGYVLFKDSKGPYHDLAMPTEKISGIESQELQTEQAPPYFSQAWGNRSHISTEMGKPLKDSWLSLAINSKYGRSQNQLHIHIACLRQDVYKQLGEQAKHIDQNWRPLAEKLVGHQYLARKLVGVDLTKEDPFRLLQQYVAGQGDNMANYGLALAVTPEGEMILLANRLKLTDLNLGSAGEIQDYQCSVAGNGV